MIEINQLDLFSGIGGFHLGFERAGFKVNSFFSEIDKHAIAVYKQQFKDSKYVGSVTNVRGADLPRIDLITFGSPCQDFSVAGTRKGMDGERSGLIIEAMADKDKTEFAPEYWDYQFKMKYYFNRNHALTFLSFGAGDKVKMIKKAESDEEEDPVMEKMQLRQDQWFHNQGLYYTYQPSKQFSNRLMGFSAFQKNEVYFERATEHQFFP